MSKVILKKSSVSGKVPLLSDLEYGELALNYADGIAYYKRSDNTIQSIKSGIGFTASETAPNNPNEGDRWLNTTTGSEFVYLNDGSSTQWVELSLSANSLPAGGTTGQLLTSGGSSEPTWTTSTSANTANAVVQRNASGNFTAGVITATDFNATSDKALKQNVLPAPGLDLINLINAVQFDWIATGDRSYGVIAQELEKLLPELVHEDEGIKTVSYIPLIAILIKSVQELKAKLDYLDKE